MRLKSKPNSSCGFFLLGNLVETGDQLVVATGRQTFVVTPPASGTMYMSARCTAGDIRPGDTVRVSLTKPGAPYAASMINIYREDTGEAVSEADPEGEAGSKIAKRGKKRSRTGTSRGSAAQRQNASKAKRYFRTGLKLLKKGKREAAIEYFDKAREADPGDAMAKRIANALGKSASRDAVAPK